MEETYQELMKYSVKRFNSAYNNHLIKDELVREIEVTLNTLTEKIYNINIHRKVYKSAYMKVIYNNIHKIELYSLYFSLF